MNQIYHNSNLLFFFSASYAAKELFVDSTQKTRGGLELIGEGSILEGFGLILLARIKSAASFAILTFTTAFLVASSLPPLSFFFVAVAGIKISFYIPGIASLESIEEFNQKVSNQIDRILKVIGVALLVIPCFLCGSAFNMLLPIPLKANNLFFRLIHFAVEPLGPLKKIIIREDKLETIKNSEPLSLIDEAEDYLRALSSQNILRKVNLNNPPVRQFDNPPARLFDWLRVREGGRIEIMRGGVVEVY